MLHSLVFRKGIVLAGMIKCANLYHNGGSEIMCHRYEGCIYIQELLDTAYSGAHTTAQHTGLQLETMSQALFRGLF